MVDLYKIQMLTNNNMQERQLDELYDWVDTFNLSRPKKNISRDFSDAVLLAEIISLSIPKIVELHNYPPSNSVRAKVSNWNTLNAKVLSKIGIHLTQDDIKRLSNSSPMAIEHLLYEVKCFIDEQHKQKQNQQSYPNPFQQPSKLRVETGARGNQGIANKLYKTSKIEELREVLALLRQKIHIVEVSIDRKDSHIKELEQTIKMYSN